jgi:hypothetical protein
MDTVTVAPTPTSLIDITVSISVTGRNNFMDLKKEELSSSETCEHIITARHINPRETTVSILLSIFISHTISVKTLGTA